MWTDGDGTKTRKKKETHGKEKTKKNIGLVWPLVDLANLLVWENKKKLDPLGMGLIKVGDSSSTGEGRRWGRAVILSLSFIRSSAPSTPPPSLVLLGSRSSAPVYPTPIVFIVVYIPTIITQFFCFFCRFVSLFLNASCLLWLFYSSVCLHQKQIVSNLIDGDLLTLRHFLKKQVNSK